MQEPEREEPYTDSYDRDGETRALRERLVRSLVDAGDLSEPSVIEAMRAVPRHRFATQLTFEQAYANHAVAIGFGQTISQPAVVAIMTEALALSGRERVLEIGTGSGYQTAVLSMLSREVFTIERIAELFDVAAVTLSSLGYLNVNARCGDGYEGWPDEAPFDRIVLTAAPPEVPSALFEQLAPNGMLVAPVGTSADEGGQRLIRYVRRPDGTLDARDIGGVAFVPMVHGKAVSRASASFRA